jgi:diaminopimelate decarboxylase
MRQGTTCTPSRLAAACPSPTARGEPVIDTQHYHGLWDAARQQAEAIVGHPLGLEIEPGRFLVAESGVLLGEVRATKNAGSNHFVLVDTGFNELMRPSMYGSYHAMSVLRRDGSHPRPTSPAWWRGRCANRATCSRRATAAWCCRATCPMRRWAICWSSTTRGAYGASMSSNYNTRPLIAEVLSTQPLHIYSDFQSALIGRQSGGTRLAHRLMQPSDLGGEPR